MNTVERARSRWKEILPQLGIEVRFLTNRKGPCPVCGGTDRFRFDDKNGEGTYYCNQCGPGVGVILLKKLHGWTHKEACDAIDEVIGKEYRPPLPPKPAPAGETKLGAIERLLAEADSPSVVSAYLKRRGLWVSSPVLRGHKACRYINGETVSLHPAVLAPIIAPDGQLESVQRVYDAAVDPRKKTMPPVRTIKGATVHLQEPTDELGVCEGFETGLAVHEMFGIPMWAALSAGNLEVFDPPVGILQLHVFADNDENCVGQNAAYSLAVRINRRNDQHKTGAAPVKVHVPPDIGDWLDVLNNTKKEAA